jgi:RHS repeat-associated protein
MLVPNRHGNSGEYRYGFNGKESDSEIKGEGLQLDYGFRIYDPRIGKFLSQDPLFKSFPWYTPYQFAGNKPIVAIDLDGLEERIVIMHTTVAGKVRREVLDAKTLLKTTDYVGVKHSALYEPITIKEFTQYKKQLWDAFSNSPELFASGYKSYTIGGMNNEKYKNSGFIGLNKGTLTIGSSELGSTISYDPTPIDRTTPSSFQIIKDAPKSSRMAAGINTAKNYIAGVSLCVSGPGLVAGEASTLGYVGAAYDVDQLTGASEKLTEGHPTAARIVGVAEIMVGLVSLKSTPIEIIDVFKGTSKATDAVQSTIVGAADTTGDIYSTTTVQP